MPRKKLLFLPGMEHTAVDCFAYKADKYGKPHCLALRDIYCLKENDPCPFRATPEEAAESRIRAFRHLTDMGML